MKILHTVEFYYPSIGGSQEVVRQLSERMVEAGHEVTVATSYLPDRHSNVHNGVTIRSFDISGNEVRGYEGDTKAYQDFVLESDFDVVMNYAAQEWTADLLYPILPKLTARKIFVPCGFSGLHEPAYKKYFQKMPDILKQYDATIYLAQTYRDIDFARTHGVKNIHIIPNGADEKEFEDDHSKGIRQKLRIAQQTQLILHVGGFTGVKGQAEAVEIFEAAAIPNSTLVLIGNRIDRALESRLRRKAWRYNLARSNRKNKRKIIIKQLNRSQTVAVLQAADIFLFPSNIEASPLVLFEACAAGTPFLTTDVGNAKEIIEWTNGGELLPTRKDNQGYSYAIIAESAEVLKKLVANPLRQKKLATAGRSAWNQKFRWDKIAEQYLDLYRIKKR